MFWTHSCASSVILDLGRGQPMDKYIFHVSEPMSALSPCRQPHGYLRPTVGGLCAFVRVPRACRRGGHTRLCSGGPARRDATAAARRLVLCTAERGGGGGRAASVTEGMSPPPSSPTPPPHSGTCAPEVLRPTCSRHGHAPVCGSRQPRWRPSPVTDGHRRPSVFGAATPAQTRPMVATSHAR